LLKKRQEHRPVSRTLSTAAAAATVGLMLAGPGVAHAAGPAGDNQDTSTAASGAGKASSAKAQNGNKRPKASAAANADSAARADTQSNAQREAEGTGKLPGEAEDKAQPEARSKAQSGVRGKSEDQTQPGGTSQPRDKSQGNGSNGTPGGASDDVPGSPPGNNGTVKIAPYGAVDDIPDNTPHPGCRFTVEWYGFDEGEDIVSTVDFAMHAPTTDATFEITEGETSVFVGGSPGAGAGNDGLDGSESYTLDFTGEAHSQQGYHVKLTVSTPHSHGNDTKTKVFWVEGCETPVEDGEDEVPPANGGTDDGSQPGGDIPQVGGEEAEDVEGEVGEDVVAGVEDDRTENRAEDRAGAEVAGVSASRGGAPNVVAVPTEVAAGVGPEGSSNPLTALLLALGASLAAVGAWSIGRGGRFRGVRQR
jgi:hypothetical protein